MNHHVLELRVDDQAEGEPRARRPPGRRAAACDRRCRRKRTVLRSGSTRFASPPAWCPGASGCAAASGVTVSAIAPSTSAANIHRVTVTLMGPSPAELSSALRTLVKFGPASGLPFGIPATSHKRSIIAGLSWVRRVSRRAMLVHSVWPGFCPFALQAPGVGHAAREEDADPPRRSDRERLRAPARPRGRRPGRGDWSGT